jgi:hypothetical protein
MTPPSALPRNQALGFSIAVALVFYSILAFVVQPEDRFTNDFYGTWSAARLLGPDLYNPEAARALQRSLTSKVDPKINVRPPIYAVLVWPLGLLPFSTAYVVWQAANMAALILFVRLWRFEPAAYIMSAFFLPLDWSFGLGQDSALMLLICGAGAWLIERKRPLAGGAILSLCAIKPHLFAFVPVVLLAQRRYRALAGMLVGGAASYLIPAAILGFGWPATFLKAATHGEAAISPHLTGMSGLLARFHAPLWVAGIVTVVGAILVFLISRRHGWMISTGFALAAGVALAPRALVYDASLFLPLLLLQVTPAAGIAIGTVLLMIVTRVALISEVAALVVLWIARPRRSAADI